MRLKLPNEVPLWWRLNPVQLRVPGQFSFPGSTRSFESLSASLHEQMGNHIKIGVRERCVSG